MIKIRPYKIFIYLGSLGFLSQGQNKLKAKILGLKINLKFKGKLKPPEKIFQCCMWICVSCSNN